MLLAISSLFFKPGWNTTETVVIDAIPSIRKLVICVNVSKNLSYVNPEHYRNISLGEADVYLDPFRKIRMIMMHDLSVQCCANWKLSCSKMTMLQLQTNGFKIDTFIEDATINKALLTIRPQRKTIEGKSVRNNKLASQLYVRTEQTLRMREGIFALLLAQRYGHNHSNVVDDDSTNIWHIPKNVLIEHIINPYLANCNVWGKVKTRLTKEENQLYKKARTNEVREKKVATYNNALRTCNDSISHANRKIDSIDKQIARLQARKDNYIARKNQMNTKKSDITKKRKVLDDELSTSKKSYSDEKMLLETSKKLKSLVNELSKEEAKQLMLNLEK